MKIIGNIQELGNKAHNLSLLHAYGFHIPATLIVQADEIQNVKEDISIAGVEKYILRPSFENEDSDTASLAGYFQSIYPLDKRALQSTLTDKKKYNKAFHTRGHILKSIIVQECVDADIYGVYFSRDPNNIFLKGGYHISSSQEGVTAGTEEDTSLKLPSLLRRELENIGNILEKKNKDPQDIEFCIKNKKIILLQTRSINTGNNTLYSFSQIHGLNGVYKKLDFPEFGEDISIFTFSILDNILKTLYVNKSIYFKKSIFPFNKNRMNILSQFSYKYKKYLLYKIGYHILKTVSFQKLDLQVLSAFYKEYYFSFDILQKSHLNLSFSYQTNCITSCLLWLEKQKYEAFCELEQVKNILHKKNTYGKNIVYLKIEEFLHNTYNENQQLIQERLPLKSQSFSKTLVLIAGKNLHTSRKNKDEGEWIFQGNITGKITDIHSITGKKSQKYVVFLENLDIDLFQYLPYIQGVVIQGGSIYSHNSIILREAKIPSIISDTLFKKNKDKTSINFDIF